MGTLCNSTDEAMGIIYYSKLTGHEFGKYTTNVHKYINEWMNG